MPSFFSRRRFLRQALTTSVAGAAGASVAHADDADEMNPPGKGPHVTRVSVTLPHLPPEFDGFRIAQLSDLHLMPYTTEKQIQRAVDLCHELKPDLVALTGDFVTSTTRPAPRLAAILGQLQAPHGLYATLGNHDFWSGHEEVVQALNNEGIRVLRNETESIHLGGQSLHLAGMDTRYMGPPSLRGTLKEWKPGEPLVMLMHEPDVVDALAAAQVEALQLSGHTHGGQLRPMGMNPPLYRRARWGRKYIAGKFNVGSMQLYVNRGIGCIGVPVRVSCPPEVTEITLRSPEVMGRLATA